MKLIDYIKANEDKILYGGYLCYFEYRYDLNYKFINFALTRDEGGTIYMLLHEMCNLKIEDCDEFRLNQCVNPYDFELLSKEEYILRKKQDIKFSLMVSSETENDCYHEIINELNKKGGRQTVVSSDGTTGTLIAVSSSDSDYYYVFVDSNLKLYYRSAVGLVAYNENNDNDLDCLVDEKKYEIMHKLDNSNTVVFADIWRGEIKFNVPKNIKIK